jgi:hypothetical protein
MEEERGKREAGRGSWNEAHFRRKVKAGRRLGKAGSWGTGSWKGEAGSGEV